MSTFSYESTFLRSALARDPFSLGDLGPEEYLRIEAEYPNLFEPYRNDLLNTSDAFDESGEQFRSNTIIKNPTIVSNSRPSVQTQPVRNPYKKPIVGRTLPANAKKCDGSCSRTMPNMSSSFPKPNTIPTRSNIATSSVTTFRPIQVFQRPGSLSKTVSKPPDYQHQYQSHSNQSQLVSINDLRKLLDEDFFTKFQAMANAAQNVNPDSSSDLKSKGSPQPSRSSSAVKIKEFFQDEVNLDLIKKEIVAKARKKYHGRIPYSGVNPMSERLVRKPPQLNLKLDHKADKKSEEEMETNLKGQRSLSRLQSLPPGPGFLRPTILKKGGQKPKNSSPLQKSVKFVKSAPQAMAAAAVDKPSVESMQDFTKKPKRSKEKLEKSWTVMDESIEDSDIRSELSTSVSLTGQIDLKGNKREEVKSRSGRESSKYSKSDCMTSYKQLKLVRNLASTYEKLGLLKLKHYEAEASNTEVPKVHTESLNSESSSFRKGMKKRTNRSVKKCPTDLFQEKLPNSKPPQSPRNISKSPSSNEQVVISSSSRRHPKEEKVRTLKRSLPYKYIAGNSYPVLEKIAKELVYKEVLRHISEVQAQEHEELRKMQELEDAEEDRILKSQADKLAKSVQETRSQSPSSDPVLLTPELTQSKSQADKEITKPLSEVQIDLDFKPVTPQLTLSMCIEQLAADKEGILEEIDVNLDNTDCSEFSDFIFSISEKQSPHRPTKADKSPESRSRTIILIKTPESQQAKTPISISTSYITLAGGEGLESISKLATPTTSKYLKKEHASPKSPETDQRTAADVIDEPLSTSTTTTSKSDSSVILSSGFRKLKLTDYRSLNGKMGPAGLMSEGEVIGSGQFYKSPGEVSIISEGMLSPGGVNIIWSCKSSGVVQSASASSSFESLSFQELQSEGQDLQPSAGEFLGQALQE